MPITFSVANAGGTVNRSRTYAISDADITRIANAFKTIAGTPGAPPQTLTTAQALDAWVSWLMDQTKARVLTFEQESAKSAQSTITAA